MPWGAPIIIAARDLADMMDALRLRQKIANCYTAFISDPDPGANYEETLPEKMEPGTIEFLPPGKIVTFADPPKGDGSSDFLIDNERAQAAGWGITYESMTGDYSQVNFSSGRMGHLEMGRNVQAWQYHMMIPQICAKIGSWFLESAGMVLNRDLSSVRIEWIPPRREMVDPSKEIPPIIDAVRAALTSPQRAIASLGEDPGTILEEWAEWKAATDAIGLIFDSDPRKAESEGSLKAQTDSTVSG
jgi:capsid protein